ncbi:hypothetical protein MMC30_005391 [Trapelia coarctata]|nr:hypothetical protein [Trapelia coarctata]
METIPSSLPTSVDSLIFPSACNNFSHTLSALKRSRLSIRNRLSSIKEDSQFVQKVAASQSLPLVANERCGSWYIPTEKKAGIAYFKSTDGHQGQWKFSLRRLNLQVLETVGEHSGCIIVDSTRSGKSIPDALSKTVPIWCTVMNRLLFPEIPASHVLYTPSNVVGQSEHAQIEDRLAGFVENITGLHLDIAALRTKLDRPLRPEWITQASSTLSSRSDKEYYRVICCTASRQERNGDVPSDGYEYIQGAGDDSEGWSRGLTPTLFWQHSSFLLSASLDEEEDVAMLLKESEAQSPKQSLIMPIYPASATWPIYICKLDELDSANITDFDGIITCDKPLPNPTDEVFKDTPRPLLLHLDCKAGKIGSRSLRDQLPRITPFITRVASRGEHPRILFACATGKDLSVGVALAALCLYFDEDGNFLAQSISEPITKDYIRRRLSWIMASKHDANPARATLQSVNAFLMEIPS